MSVDLRMRQSVTPRRWCSSLKKVPTEGGNCDLVWQKRSLIGLSFFGRRRGMIVAIPHTRSPI
eukprot:scaffold136541_cov28-Tisochrysis_lutea.AAC.2